MSDPPSDDGLAPEAEPEVEGPEPAPPPPPTPKAPPPGAVESTGPGDRPIRTFAIGLSCESLALAWARQENAPHGATVLVKKEVSARGRNGRLWATNRFAAQPDRTMGRPIPLGGGFVGLDPSSNRQTLAFSVVLRPTLSDQHRDALWLAIGTATVEGIALVTDREFQTWWPDSVIDPGTGEEVAMLSAEVQLGPGQVRSAVVTSRIDLSLIGIQPDDSEPLLHGVLEALDRASEDLSQEPGLVAAAYENRCALMGRRVKLALRPKGEGRGVVKAVDDMARLRLESPTGMVERITLDQLKAVEVM